MNILIYCVSFYVLKKLAYSKPQYEGRFERSDSVRTENSSQDLQALKQEEEIQKQVDVLTETLKNTESELKKIQETCRHSETIIGNKNPDGRFEPVKVCNICDAHLGIPSKEDLQKAGYQN